MLSRKSPIPYMREAMTSLERMHRGYDRGPLIQMFFEEWNVSRQCTTGDGSYYVPEYAAGPDGSFYANQLGFGPHNPDADVLHTSRTARAANAERKNQLKKNHQDQQRALKFAAKRLGVRPVLEPWQEAQGCTGCGSCVRGARVAPKTMKISGSFVEWRALWTPGSLPRALRERAAVIGLLQSWAAFVRRARKEERSAAYKERNQRHAGARGQMQKRRDEEATVQRLARALGAPTTARR